MSVYTLSQHELEHVLSHLRSAASTGDKLTQRSVLCVVAALIAAQSGTRQLQAMDAATKAGFVPEFYPGAIRVHLPAES